MRIIGIDPGSIHTGYGIVDCVGSRMTRVTSGTIKAGRGDFSRRLEVIYREIVAICEQTKPDVGAIEGIFHQKHAQSALKLGHARGVALLALTHATLPVTEYEPTVVKKSLTGKGGADKMQVQRMVCALLRYNDAMAHDESDALAIAMCHAARNPVLNRRAL